MSGMCRVDAGSMGTEEMRTVYCDTMLILQLGRMVGIGFERPYVMMNNNVRDVSEVISTFVYTRGILNQRYPLSTAVDLFGSVINMIFLIAANRITRAMGGEGGLW